MTLARVPAIISPLSKARISMWATGDDDDDDALLT